MSNGFFAMPHFDYPNLLTEMVYCYLCKRARWQREPKKENTIEIKQCQVIASIRNLSEVFGVHRNRMTATLKFLASERLLTIERLRGDSENRSIVTICNDVFIKDQCTNTVPTSVPTSVPTPVPTSVPTSVPTTHDLYNDDSGLQAPNKVTREQDKQDNNTVKTKRRVSLREPHSDHDINLGLRWVEWTTSQWPHLKANADTYANAIAKVKKATNLQDAELDFIFAFIIQDPFWSPNCQSPAGLLKLSKNGVRKIDNVLASMKGKYKNQTEIARLSKIIEEKKAGTYVEPAKERKEYIF